MKLLVCSACLQALRVRDWQSSLFEELEKDGFHCPFCEGLLSVLYEAEVAADTLAILEVTEVTSEELHRAQYGLGLPFETAVCTLEQVSQLLKTHTVARLHGVNIPNTKRCVLEAIELDNGTRIYLGNGGAGPTVYRITKRVKHTERVLSDG